MDALVSSFLFQGSIDDFWLLLPLQDHWSVCLCPCPTPPQAARPAGYSGTSSSPGACPTVHPSTCPPGLVSTITPSHRLPFPPPARGTWPAYIGALAAAKKPSTSSTSAEPQATGIRVSGYQGLHLGRMAASCFSQEGGATGTHMFSGSHRKPCSSNGHWLQVCAGPTSSPHTGKSKVSYPGLPVSLGHGAVRPEGSCNLIQKVLEPREADSMQAEPKPDWDGGVPSVCLHPFC